MNFEKCTLVELRQLAKEKGIKNVSKLKKDELITILSDNKNETETVKNADRVEAQSVQLNTEKKAEKVESEYNNNHGGYKVTNADDQIIEGILEVLPDGYGFLRGENYLHQKTYMYHQFK